MHGANMTLLSAILLLANNNAPQQHNIKYSPHTIAHTYINKKSQFTYQILYLFHNRIYKTILSVMENFSGQHNQGETNQDNNRSKWQYHLDTLCYIATLHHHVSWDCLISRT